MSRTQAWITGLAVTSVAVMASAAWIDRPVANLVDSLLGHPDILMVAGHTPGLYVPLAVLAIALLIARRTAAQPFGRADAVLLLVSISAAIGLAVRAPLKLVFGRAWPQTLVRHDIYGFYPFQASEAFGSFPSGHMAAVCGVLSVLWIWYPRFRRLYVAVAILFAAGLVAANYHFVGDVIAGGFLGVTTGIVADGGWRLWRRRRPSCARARR